MKKTTVTVRWNEGLHLLPASRLVRLALRFRSKIHLRRGARVAEATSVLSLLILCAVINTPIDIEANGSDEGAAIEAVQRFFEQPGE